jgi:hypothetical protein
MVQEGEPKPKRVSKIKLIKDYAEKRGDVSGQNKDKD